VLVVGYLIVQGFFNAAGAAYAGLVPDVVPAQEFGRASGFLATMVQLGSGFGLGATTATAGLNVGVIYAIMGAVVLVTLLPTLWVASGEGTVAAARKPRLPFAKAAREFLRPLAGGDFAWVVFTRFMISAGITSVAYFLFNFFRDVVGVANPGQFTPTWFLVVLVVAVPFGLAAGHLSDRFGRKLFVYLSGGFQAAVALFFVVFFPTNIPIVYAVGALYGVGYGCYYAVDWALACDTLPDRSAVAKDMGLFHVALTLPQTYIPFIAGVTLDYFNRQSANSGYRVIFSAAVVFLILGTVFVSRIRSVR
jgi:MFS family permease